MTNMKPRMSLLKLVHILSGCEAGQSISLHIEVPSHMLYVQMNAQGDLTTPNISSNSPHLWALNSMKLKHINSSHIVAVYHDATSRYLTTPETNSNIDI